MREGLTVLIDPLLGREPWNTWFRITVALWGAVMLSFVVGIGALMMPGVANEIPPRWSFWGAVSMIGGFGFVALIIPAAIATCVAASLYASGTPRTVRLRRSRQKPQVEQLLSINASSRW